MAGTTVNPQKILEAVKTVRPLSPGAGQLLEVMGEGGYEIADIVKVIETDAALTANVLRVVNSAAMGVRREIKTVHEAVAFLGETKVIGIALAASVGETFNAELAGYHGNRGDLGRHCLWVAIAARELARHTNGVVDEGVAFTAGLLHDIGKVVISDHLVDLDPMKLVRVEVGDGPDYLTSEQNALGTDHCEVGDALGRQWQMPASLIEGIAFHHRPDQAAPEARAMAYVIHLADTLAMMQGFDTGIDAMQYSFDPDYVNYLDLDAHGLEALSLDVQIDFKTTAEALFGDQQETEDDEDSDR